MIKFFRKIRQKLLVENRFNKYLLYAIGEIVLVVIGILIALQINNWNQQRLENKDENTILSNLNEEFLENQKNLELGKKELIIAKNVGLQLMSLMGKSEAYINKFNKDSLLFVVLESGSFRPSENTIDDLIQSGRLKLLKNKKLKSLLYQWKVSLQSLQSQFLRMELKLDNDLIPYLSKNYSLKDMDKYGALQWKEKTSLSIDKNKIFSDILFENILDDYLYRIRTTENGITEIEILINNILNETDTKQ